MKVLFVFFGDDYHGGTTYSTFTLARGLVERGHEVHAFARVTREGTLARDLEACGVSVHDGRASIVVHPMRKQPPVMAAVRIGLELGRRLYTLGHAEREIGRIIQDCGIELVVISSGAIVNGARAASRLGIPYVWHVREFMQEDHRLDYYAWANAYQQMNEANALICVSHAVAAKMRRVCADARVEVAYNGIDQEAFTADGRSARAEDEPIRLMFSGGINPSKGTYLLLEALSSIRDEQPFTLDIYGAEGVSAGSHARDLEAACQRLGLADIVHYRGVVSNIADELRRHDIQVVASQAEAFGRVTAEAMCCGCAVVGSDAGGTPELLADGRGYLFKPNDAASLAEVLRQAMCDESGRVAAAAKALAYAREHFTVERYVDSVEAVYLSVVS